MIQDKKLNKLDLTSALIFIVTLAAILFFAGIKISSGIMQSSFLIIGVGTLFLMLTGYFINNPNEATIIELFGHYVGTYFNPGIFVTVPLSSKYPISLRFNSINTDRIKVNDANGSPIEISAVIVWRVDSPAKAYYNVNNYMQFVSVQSESVIREFASNYPYDSENNEESLRKNSDVISDELKSMLQERLSIAGVEIIEAKVSHLAYSPEIAQAMLRRQQAHAITSARRHIVQNAISIIEEVIEHFEKNKGMQLDNKEKVQLINNLLVTLVSERDVHPTIDLRSE